MDLETRRAFIGKVSVAAPAVVGAATASAVATQPSSGRRTVGGSSNPAFSRATAFGGLVYASGVVGRKPGAPGPISDDFETQCRQSLENLKASVEGAGSTMAKVLKCTCFLTDLADFPEFNSVFRDYFPKDPPARSTVVVKELVVPGAKLEIDCVACIES